MYPHATVAEVANLTSPELWATWTTAVGTILAALVPTILYFFERRERIQLQQKLDEAPKRQAEEEARNRSLAEHATARRVFPRVGITPLPDAFRAGEFRATFSYSICNRSDERVWEVRIFAKIGDQEHKCLSHHSLLLPYEETEQIDIDFVSSQVPHLVKTDVFIEYTNSQGDLWRTYYDGSSELSGRESDRYPLPS